MSLLSLNVASLESPEFVHVPGLQQSAPERYYPDFDAFENQTFENDRIVVDNRQFRNCKFRACNLVYAGGMYGFVDCEFDAQTSLSLTGSAARSVASRRAIAEHPDTGAWVGRHLGTYGI